MWGSCIRLLGHLICLCWPKEISDTKDAAAEESENRHPLNEHQDAEGGQVSDLTVHDDSPRGGKSSRNTGHSFIFRCLTQTGGMKLTLLRV